MKAVVIGGAGEVRYHIAKFFSHTHDVIIVEKDEEVARRADELDVQVLEGNGANVDVLASIIHDADILIAITGIDEVNIVACMTAKLNKASSRLERNQDNCKGKQS